VVLNFQGYKKIEMLLNEINNTTITTTTMNLISEFEQLQKFKNENRKKEEILENKIMRAMKKAFRIVRIKQQEEQAQRQQQQQQQEEQAQRQQQEEQAQRQQQEEQAQRPRKDVVRTTRRPIKENHPTNEQIVIMTKEYSKETCLNYTTEEKSPASILCGLLDVK